MPTSMKYWKGEEMTVDNNSSFGPKNVKTATDDQGRKISKLSYRVDFGFNDDEKQMKHQGDMEQYDNPSEVKGMNGKKKS